MRYRLPLAVLAVAVAVVTQLVVLSGSAEAAAPPTGRAHWQGYFYNKCDDYGASVFNEPGGGDALPVSSVYDANSLINFMINAYNEGPGEDRTGEAFVVLTMDGYKLPPGGVIPQSVSPTSSYFKQFEGIVNYYYTNHWIQGINNNTTSYSYAYNTYYQNWPGDPGCTTNSVDDAWYNDNGSTLGAIIFHDPGTANYFVIRRHCGNPLGSDSLTIPNFNVNVSLNRNGSPNQVEAGKAYSAGITVQNTGTTPSVYASAQIPQPGQIVAPCTPWCIPAMGSLSPNYNYSYGFANNPANANPGVSGNRWTWYTNPIPAHATATAYFDFTVSPGATPGTTITFTAYFWPANLANAEHTATVTFLVVSERQPAVTGLNGDVQAGGGICGQAQTNGYVKGYTGAGSYGQYVVSAGTGTNAITDFSSNGTGANILNLGQTGGYSRVCRPDLLSVANAYRAGGGAGISTRPGGTNYDISGWQGVYYIDGSAGIYGTVNNRLTIVVNAPALTIVSPGIQLTGASATAQNLPSLGVIASGDIDIDASVTRVDAYLFADGTIDTCLVSSGSCSTPQLVVNGFLMANNILFDRLGPFNTNGTPVSEQIVLNPQIYLNPPQFFDSSTDQVLLQGQGEKSPLY